MGKIIKAIVFISIVTVFILVICNKPDKNADADDDGILVIRDRLFIGQVNDIYLNTEDYLGKTIKLEGVYKKEQYDDDKTYNFVIRYGPGGCCGYDGYVGFEIAMESYGLSFPEPESWIEVTGVLKNYQENEFLSYPYIDLTSIDVLKKRGKEYVNQ
jgi:uncharacterized membrane protein YcgQ (UPF0703/DUF1980 family)